MLGKTAGKDLLSDKATYPSLLGLERSRQARPRPRHAGSSAKTMPPQAWCRCTREQIGGRRRQPRSPQLACSARAALRAAWRLTAHSPRPVCAPRHGRRTARHADLGMQCMTQLRPAGGRRADCGGQGAAGGLPRAARRPAARPGGLHRGAQQLSAGGRPQRSRRPPIGAAATPAAGQAQDPRPRGAAATPPASPGLRGAHPGPAPRRCRRCARGSAPARPQYADIRLCRLPLSHAAAWSLARAAPRRWSGRPRPPPAWACAPALCHRWQRRMRRRRSWCCRSVDARAAPGGSACSNAGCVWPALGCRPSMPCSRYIIMWTFRPHLRPGAARLLACTAGRLHTGHGWRLTCRPFGPLLQAC